MFTAFSRSKELTKKRLPNYRRSAASIRGTRAMYLSCQGEQKREKPNRTSEENKDFLPQKISGILGTAE
jgi:hypothetical protein